MRKNTLRPVVNSKAQKWNSQGWSKFVPDNLWPKMIVPMNFNGSVITGESLIEVNKYL